MSPLFIDGSIKLHNGLNFNILISLSSHHYSTNKLF